MAAALDAVPPRARRRTAAMTVRDRSAASADARWLSRLKETGHSTWLLSALVLMLVAYPFLDHSFAGKVALGVLNTAILGTGAFVASGSRRMLHLAIGFAVPALGLQWATVIGRNDNVTLVYLITMVLFYVFTITLSLNYVLRPGVVSGNKLHAGVAAYIMIGMLWSFVYTVIDVLVPGSFDYMGNIDTHVRLDWREFLFFSFVTLTTTGYGDIVPVTRIAQAAAILQQLAGTFYIAILIARLAGLYEPDAPSRPRR